MIGESGAGADDVSCIHRYVCWRCGATARARRLSAYPEHRDVAEVTVASGGIDPLDESRGQNVGEHHGVAAEGLAGQRFAELPHPGLKPAAGSGKNVRRKVGQDRLWLHNYNYRTSAGFPSPAGPEKWLNPVPFGTDLF